MTIDSRQRLAFDLETHLFGPGNMAPRPVCVAVAHGTTRELYAIADGVRVLAPWFERAIAGEALLVGHNVAFDLACLHEHAAELRPLIWRALGAGGVHCTLVRERLLDIERGSRWDEESGKRKELSLAAIALVRTGIELDKGSDSWRRGYEALDGVPVAEWPDEARAYALNDARATLGVWESQEVAADRAGYRAWRDEAGRQTAFSFALYLTAARGLRVDQASVRALRAELEPKIGAARATMAAHGLLHAKTGAKNLAAIRQAVETTWGGEGEIPRTPTGATKTSAEVVGQCSHPALVAFSTFAHLEKLSSAFLSKLEDTGDAPIHARYDVLGADTGRVSCSSPNIQQQPREPGVRECFAARPGFVFVSCDFDAQEVRSFAQVLKVVVGKSALADRYAKDPDFDPHSAFAAEILKITYAEAMTRKRAKDKEFKEWRQRAKASIFGVPGGMGAKTLRLYARGYDLELTLDEAAQLRERYFSFEPYARQYFSSISNRIDTGLTRFEQLYSGRLRGDCGYTDGCNTLFQGLASDASKNALWEVVRRCFGAPGVEGSPLFGCRPVAFIHDEILLEAPESYAHEAAVELERVMIAAQEELTPDVPARASPALMRRWSKLADEARDASGRLVPWEDRNV